MKTINRVRKKIFLMLVILLLVISYNFGILKGDWEDIANGKIDYFNDLDGIDESNNIALSDGGIIIDDTSTKEGYVISDIVSIPNGYVWDKVIYDTIIDPDSITYIWISVLDSQKIGIQGYLNLNGIENDNKYEINIRGISTSSHSNLRLRGDLKNWDGESSPKLDEWSIKWAQDNDEDGMADYWESENSVTNPNLDPDNDDLTNLIEFQYNTNPNDSDTDNDNYDDGEETNVGEISDSEITTFSDDSSQKTLTFNGEGTQTVYIDIPMSEDAVEYITKGVMKITGVEYQGSYPILEIDIGEIDIGDDDHIDLGSDTEFTTSEILYFINSLFEWEIQKYIENNEPENGEISVPISFESSQTGKITLSDLEVEIRIIETDPSYETDHFIFGRMQSFETLPEGYGVGTAEEGEVYLIHVSSGTTQKTELGNEGFYLFDIANFGDVFTEGDLFKIISPNGNSYLTQVTIGDEGFFSSQIKGIKTRSIQVPPYNIDYHVGTTKISLCSGGNFNTDHLVDETYGKVHRGDDVEFFYNWELVDSRTSKSRKLYSDLDDWDASEAYTGYRSDLWFESKFKTNPPPSDTTEYTSGWDTVKNQVDHDSPDCLVIKNTCPLQTQIAVIGDAYYEIQYTTGSSEYTGNVGINVEVVVKPDI